jgi:ubiquinone/menaquinone biosynthesis C-methylase UbiE
MILAVRILTIVLLCAGTSAMADAIPAGGDREDHYQYRSPSRDGIGKVYMGREISFVLGHRGIRWLERPERSIEERPEVLIDLLDLSPEAVIADIGAGSGYFTFRIQPEVPRGKVLAVDIQPEMLESIEAKRDELGVTNVETVLGTVTDPNLSEGSIDAALMVDAYHEFSHPREMMEGIVRALVPGGLVFLVEYRAEDPDVPMLPLHKMTVKQARREMAAVGLEFVENRKGLPWQHVLVFRKGLD